MAATTVAAKSRPATCAALFAAGNTEHAVSDCKRLPRHGGEHRPFLTVAAANRAAKPKAAKASKPAKRVTKASAKAQMVDIAAAVEAGTMSAADALSAASRLLDAARMGTRKPAASPKVAAVDKTAAAMPVMTIAMATADPTTFAARQAATAKPRKARQAA
jgi:hypothetical protein